MLLNGWVKSHMSEDNNNKMTAHCTIVQKNVEVLHDSIGQKKHSQLGLCVRVNVESGGGLGGERWYCHLDCALLPKWERTAALTAV